MITARTAGFCFGVERAVGAVYDLVGSKDRPGSGQSDPAGADIVTFGPIIHNEVVVEDLRQKGVGVINTAEEISSHAKGTIVIRSHGVSRQLYDTIHDSGARVVDTTCTFVKRIHDIVAADSAAGRQIVIIGNHGHAEVEGHKGWCADPQHHPAMVIETAQEAQNAPLSKEQPVSVVAQTTFNGERFAQLVDILRERGFSLQVHNTICNATRERQEEARTIAAKVDIMLVIGGKSSSNTAKLYDICKAVCPRTFLIQTVKDLKVVKGTGQLTAFCSEEENSGEESSRDEGAEAVKGPGLLSSFGEESAGREGSGAGSSAEEGSGEKGLATQVSTGIVPAPAGQDGAALQHPMIIGITAGASTPKNIIEEVQSYVRGADF